MPTLNSQAQQSIARRAGRHAARIEGCWPTVRVESAELSASPAGDRARTVVQLGGLTPADVRVELIPLDERLAAGSPPGGYRMFSCQGYGNGCFVFEATIPAGTAERSRGWMIHVHPSEAAEDTRVEFRFQPCADGARR